MEPPSFDKSSDTRLWTRFPRLKGLPQVKQWLEIQQMLGLAPNTVMAYARGLDDLVRWCHSRHADIVRADRALIAAYIGDLRARPGPRGPKVVSIESGSGLSNATMQQRLTAVRLFFDHLIEEGLRQTNPVGRGRYTPGHSFAKPRNERAILRRFKRLPWIPTEDEWRRFLSHARKARSRDRLMIALAYDAALRREELCLLESRDIDPAHRLVHVRAETSKGRRDRIVPYSATTGALLRVYLSERRALSREQGRLFLSESPRNRRVPITLWTWSKVVRQLAASANLPKFSTHTLRHLSLTDLARAGWELHEIALFAGHRNVSTTLQYIHLSGRDLSKKVAESMTEMRGLISCLDNEVKP